MSGLSNVLPGAQLRFSSMDEMVDISLEITADKSGTVYYQYQEAGKLVNNQQKAANFMRQMLAVTLSDKGAFIDKIKTRVSQAFGNGALSVAKRTLAVGQMMKTVPSLFEVNPKQPPPSWIVVPKEPFSFTGVVINGPNVALIDVNGILQIKTIRVDGVEFNAYFDLKSRKRLAAFLNRTGQAYIPGDTEKAMVEELIYDRFVMLAQDFTWVFKYNELPGFIGPAFR
jgi:hypothetical protein